MGIRGSVDAVASTEISGWAFAPAAKEPVVVQALLNHEILGEAVANIPRPDLKSAGFGSGKCGFAIELNRPIDPLYLPFIVVRPEGGDVELPRSSLGGFADFFRAVHAGFPLAGRHRSVHGGLWTDRGDAPALLRGKIAIGQIGAAVEPALNQLINAGFALVPLKAALARDTDDDDWLELAARLVEDSRLLGIVQAIFEDAPVVLNADEITAPETALWQVSAATKLLSPGESMAIVTPISEKPVSIDVLRGGHLLPEFSADGASRWTHPLTDWQQRALAEGGAMDRAIVSPGFAALIGPGALHRVRPTTPGGEALRLIAAPSRTAPAERVLGARDEYVSPAGTRVLQSA